MRPVRHFRLPAVSDAGQSAPSNPDLDDADTAPRELHDGLCSPPHARPVRRSLMATLRELRTKAQASAHADAEVIAARFRRQDRVRIRRFAAKSFAHGEIAEQFPMLAFMLASKLVDPARQEAAERAIAACRGLAHIARAAGVPMWTRALPPAACEDPNGALPDSSGFSCRISALLRRQRESDSDLRGLVRTVAQMHGAGGEELALWLAHRTPENGLVEQLPAPFRMLVLWYLFSQRETGLGRELIHTPWRADLSLETALRAVKNFSRRLDLELLLGSAGIADPWYERVTIMDLDFVPLLTSADIRAEAVRNTNCLDWYGQRLAGNEVRLFSVRTLDGVCVGNVELSGSDTHPHIPRLAQVKAPKNEAASSYLSEVTEIWLRRQIRAHGYPDMKRRRLPAPDGQRWHAIMAPLREAGELPPWAFLAPALRDIQQTELEFTMLSCRLHTRGWRFG